MNAEKYTRLVVDEWLDELSKWAPDRERLLDPWCNDCARSSLVSAIPDARELPHSIVHPVLQRLEAAIAHAKERFADARFTEMRDEWRLRTEPDFEPGDYDSFDIEYLIELQTEFHWRQRWEEENVRRWTEDTRADIYRVLQDEVNQRAQDSLQAVRWWIARIIDGEVDALETTTLADAEDVDRARLSNELETMLAEWMTWLPAKQWQRADQVPEGHRCATCSDPGVWLADVEAPHGAMHPLRVELDRIQELVLDTPTVPLEQPASKTALPRHTAISRMLHVLVDSKRDVIVRAIHLYVADLVDLQVEEAARGISVLGDDERLDTEDET